MKKIILTLTIAILTAATAVADDKVPLKTDLPKPVTIGTPIPVGDIPHLEPKPVGNLPDFMVPVGTINLAKGKTVTSSDTNPITGTIDLVTDGDKSTDEGSWVGLGPGKQWVQIDLEKASTIYAVIVWHYHGQDRVYRDVVVQASNDPGFAGDVTTIFDNSAAGKNNPYVEDCRGKLMDAKGAKGRYVRLYSNGSTAGKMNEYIEVEVWGKPAA